MANDVHRGSWRAMGSSVDVIVVGASALLLDEAKTSIDHLERRWSRFLPDSDISRLNHAAGSPVHIDPATVVLLDAMLDGWRVTGGAFDPTLLAPLVGLGYAASWHDPASVTSLPHGASMRGDMRALAVDRAHRVVSAPLGTCLDAGGIGKGLAADLVAEQLIRAGAYGASVSIGGDVALRGRAPQADGWLVGIADPFATAESDVEVGQLLIVEGGVATSGTLRHRWRGSNGGLVHHVLDPHTGDPVHHPNEIISVTVVAGTAGWAEVWTKAVMVCGDASLTLLEQHGLGACVVHADGTQAENESWRKFVSRPVSPDASAQQRSHGAGDEVEMVEV